MAAFALLVLAFVFAGSAVQARSLPGTCTLTDHTDQGADYSTGKIGRSKFSMDLAGCKELCLNDDACVALSLYGSDCDLFYALPSFGPEGTSDAFSTKTCSEASSPTASSVSEPTTSSLQTSPMTSPPSATTATTPNGMQIACACQSTVQRAALELDTAECVVAGTLNKDACPDPISVSEFQEIARSLKECIERFSALTGNKPQLPAYKPDSTCKLIGFNLEARKKQFQAEACQRMVQDACPARVSISEFEEIARNLWECIKRLTYLTGNKPQLPANKPDPTCKLIGFNLQARTMQFQAEACQRMV